MYPAIFVSEGSCRVFQRPCAQPGNKVTAKADGHGGRPSSERSIPKSSITKFHAILSSFFTPRHEIYKQMGASCLISNQHKAQQKRFVIHGLGGSGKTQLYLKFAEDHREEYASSTG